ncbi:MAG: hypothetical protein ACKOA1_06350, partial [Bacteroidota bacterium]
ADLDINNIRTPVLMNGDMWWDLVNAGYEVPKGSNLHSLFSGAIWIGGKDNPANGQLKVAAQTYRQSGEDFWPGPMDTANTSVSADVCAAYDRHWKVSKAEVKAFVEYYQANNQVDPNTPEAIKSWPGSGDPSKNQAKYIAPFVDNNGDGRYNYEDGDYPYYNLGTTSNCDVKDQLYGDQTLFWVFNDVGADHSETGSLSAIGLEIQAQAFGFATNDEINNMSFYRYKLINRASQALYETYFGAWVDPDLGNYLDDYVGCDVKRGFGYCYNGDENDEGAVGYGANPPAIGVDFFEGPLADIGDGIDNNRDSVIDEPDEQIIMSKFVYYNNDGSPTGNPNDFNQYYNYMRGIWKDQSPLVYGGTGYQTAGYDSCDFMFPGDTDPNGWGTKGVPLSQLFPWSETEPLPGAQPNTPSDRRFIQTAGPFTLQPGAVNYITTGVVWARSTSGGALASLKLVRLADDKAQLLFNSCFKVIDGPDAPELAVREMDRELILSIINPASSNNYREEYAEDDKESQAAGNPGSKYRFEGYKVFQLKSASVSVTDLNNPDKARMIFQCDIKNGIAQIVNQYYQPELNAIVSVEEVVGEDNGLRHTFRVNTDAFATGNSALVNHTTYYFMAIAYAYNPDQQTFDPYVEGLGKPYIAGRRNATGGSINIYTAIPHNPTPEFEGLILGTTYGDGPEIQRITGNGNGINVGTDRLSLDLRQDQIDDIIFNSTSPVNEVQYPVYARGRGPVDIRVYDPVKVVPGNFELWVVDSPIGDSRWVLRNMANPNVLDSAEKSLQFPYDQLFPNYGFYISMNQVGVIGKDAVGNGFVEATKEYTNANFQWLTGITDDDADFKFNWIRSGPKTPDYPLLDDGQVYEKVLSGTWAPFALCANDIYNTADGDSDIVVPAPPGKPNIGWDVANPATKLDSLSYLCSVDIVLTNDKSKWSRCVVFETQTSIGRSEGRQARNLIRKHLSWNLDGTYSTTDSGFSWFPGYAINVETGERLNIAFGEDSYLDPANGYSGETGADMIYNPTSTFFGPDGRLVAGGKHYIYVFSNKRTLRYPLPADTSYYGGGYDGCQRIYDQLWSVRANANTGGLTATNQKKANRVWKDCMWVSCSYVAPGQRFLASDVKVRLRVSRPYQSYVGTATDATHGFRPFYKFSTDNLTARIQQNDVAKNALDLINIVPNPYYAYSNYEQNQFDNRVRITNLPSNCTVSIYTTSGILVRRLRRDAGLDNTDGKVFPELNLATYIDWDLKNTESIPVASGIYLIHVLAPGIGERTLKWFGVMRPIDLDTF